MTDFKDIKGFLDGGFCIGCGACAVSDNKINISKNEYGLLYVNSEIDELKKQADVCPFLSAKNEDELSAAIYKEVPNIKFEKKIGYYLSLYGGHVIDKNTREESSSGGLANWLLEKLLITKRIDAVIHVGEVENDLFGYKISKNLSELRGNKKSRYYPTHFDEVIKDLDLNKRYAFVGIPCYIKAMRLLCEKNHKLKESIAYFIGIFCGHLKSSAFAELLAWQQGVTPSNLAKIDFRKKNSIGRSSNYSISVIDTNNNSYAAVNNKLYGTDWGLGLFKPRGCDWCDDVSGEIADAVFGDAWLPEYINDSLGDNIVIVRNPLIDEILSDGMTESEIKINLLSIDKIIQSQAGNYRHRQEGLSVRINDAEKKGEWYPAKRIKKNSYNVTKERKNIYLLRSIISNKSHRLFLEAKRSDSLLLFFVKMAPLTLKYYLVNKNFLKGGG